jgi:putative transcriptional regulator
MAVSYKKLWKLLIDRDLKKKDLEAMAQVSHYTMNKLTMSPLMCWGGFATL